MGGRAFWQRASLGSGGVRTHMRPYGETCRRLPGNGPRGHDQALDLPDLDDRQVFAATVDGCCGNFVTKNPKDFSRRLSRHSESRRDTLTISFSTFCVQITERCAPRREMCAPVSINRRSAWTSTLKPWPRKGFRKRSPNLNGTAIRCDAPLSLETDQQPPSDASPACRSGPVREHAPRRMFGILELAAQAAGESLRCGVIQAATPTLGRPAPNPRRAAP